jgi:hypothetical protein
VLLMRWKIKKCVPARQNEMKATTLILAVTAITCVIILSR